MSGINAGEASHEFRGEAGSEACCSLSRGGVIEVSGLEELRELASRCRVVFINFYSPMCTYCYLFEPVYSRVASEMAGKAAFARVNVARSLELAGLFGIMATPTTIALVDGRAELMIPGYMDYEDFHGLAHELLRKTGCISPA